jgi:HAMP domain-containing protein
MGGVTPDWLAQLAPAHAPPPPGWWPLAPGWWVLAALLVLGVVAVWLWQRRPQVRLRRAALRELAQLDKTIAADADLARELTHLVRRYAVARYGRDAVATLSGRRWIDFVVAHGGTPWAGDVGLDLLRAAYGGPCQPERARWLVGAKAFFRSKA